MRYSGSVFRSILIIWIFLCPFAAAQTLTVGGNVSSLGLEPEVRLEGVKAEGLTFGARAAFDLGSETLELGANARFNTSLGPLGNVAVMGRADANTAGAFAASVRGSGVLGSIGARVRLAAFNTNPGRFVPEDLLGDERPFLLGTPQERLFAAQFGLGLTYRLSRTSILNVDPDLLYANGGFGVRGTATLELRRLRNRDDGVLLAEGYLKPGGPAGYGAVGFTYALNARRAPLIRGSLLVGAGSEGLYPGARFSLQTRGEIDYTLSLAAEPYRADLPKLRAEVSASGALGAGDLRTVLLTAPLEDFGAPLFVLRSAYELEF